MFHLPLAEIAEHSAMASAGVATEPMGLWPFLVHANVPNVLLVAIALGLLIKGLNVPTLLEQSANSIAAELDDAQFLKDSATFQHQIIEEERAALPARRDEALKEAAQMAQQVQWQIEQQTDQEVLRIQANTLSRLSQEERRLAFTLQQIMVAQLLASLKDALAQQVNTQHHRRMVEQFMDRLPTLVAQEPSLRRAF
jgi:F0F1-type ATP synthase membrane subunit b/b'